MKLDIGIQIVNYKSKKYLDTCISDLLKDLKWIDLSSHIFVLDNNSGDDLSDLSEKYSCDQISFFDSDKNHGFGAGHNFLAKQYDAKALLCVNPDIRLVQRNTVKNLYDFLYSDENIGVAWLNTNSARDHGNKIPLFFTKIGFSLCTSLSENCEVAWVQGSFFMIKKYLFDVLWGFDEKFFLYKEEEDLQLRLRLLWKKVMYTPKLSVNHIGWVSTKWNKWKEKRKSDWYFVKKWIFNKDNIAKKEE